MRNKGVLHLFQMLQMASEQQAALTELGRRLLADGYHFITPTPETHRRVNARLENQVACCPRGVFGWSRPFAPDLLPEALLALMERGNILVSDGNLLRSIARFSSLEGQLFIHSAYPTLDGDAVFFGPDTYRFVRFLKSLPRPAPDPLRIIDIGAGSGAGGLAIAAHWGGDIDVVLGDINDLALHYSRVNAALNAVAGAATRHSDILAGIDGDADLIVSNPPYLVDSGKRRYRHGGGALGCELSQRIVAESLPRLRPGGRLVLYTGSAIVAGRDLFRAAIAAMLDGFSGSWRYEEIDPDVFGEELEAAPYDRADRIAVVALTVTAADKELQ